MSNPGHFCLFGIVCLGRYIGPDKTPGWIMHLKDAPPRGRHLFGLGEVKKLIYKYCHNVNTLSHVTQKLANSFVSRENSFSNLAIYNSTVELGYNDHGYNEYTVITNKMT